MHKAVDNFCMHYCIYWLSGLKNVLVIGYKSAKRTYGNKLMMTVDEHGVTKSMESSVPIARDMTQYTSITTIIGLNWTKTVFQAIQRSNLVIFQNNWYSVMWSAVNLGWFVASFLNTRFTAGS